MVHQDGNQATQTPPSPLALEYPGKSHSKSPSLPYNPKEIHDFLDPNLSPTPRSPIR